MPEASEKVRAELNSFIMNSLFNVIYNYYPVDMKIPFRVEKYVLSAVDLNRSSRSGLPAVKSEVNTVKI